MSRSGRAVPLSLPLDSQNLRVLRTLRQNADTLQTRLQALDKLQSQLHELASKPQWEAIVPVEGTSGLASVGSSRWFTLTLGTSCRTSVLVTVPKLGRVWPVEPIINQAYSYQTKLAPSTPHFPGPSQSTARLLVHHVLTPN